MDISDLIPTKDTVTVELKNKKGEPLINKDGSPMTWTRYLPHSKEYKEARYAQQDYLLSKKVEEIGAKESNDLFKDFLVNTTADWNLTYNGKQPKFGKKVAKEILDKVDIFVNQLLEGEHSSEDFT